MAIIVQGENVFTRVKILILFVPLTAVYTVPTVL